KSQYTHILMNFDFELTSIPITFHAGLAFIGEKLSEAKFERHMQTIGPANPRSDRTPDANLAKTMIGLICVGKPTSMRPGDTKWAQLAAHRNHRFKRIAGGWTE